MNSKRGLRDSRQAYAQGRNVMAMWRDRGSSETNTVDAIEVAYDLQTGSYRALMERPSFRETQYRFCSEIAAYFDRLGARTVLEAGVGEATTLAHVLERVSRPPNFALGFDLSWSRASWARSYLGAIGVAADLFVAELSAIPLPDDSIDVVFTSHAVEPNRGREREILAELHRVAGRYLMLIEPSNALGSEDTRRHMEIHKYCLDLHAAALELGFDVIEHRIFDNPPNPSNQQALILVRKKGADTPSGGRRPPFSCPSCRAALSVEKGHLFCREEGLVYPVLDGIPCLRIGNSVIASRFSDEPRLTRPPGPAGHSEVS